MVIHERMWKQWLQNLPKRSVTQRWLLTPLLLRSHVWLYPRIIFIQVPWKYVKVCGYSDPFFFKNLNQRSLTTRQPLTPSLLRSHVWLYPRIIVSKSHENTSKYVNTVNLFSKTWTTGHWPLDDLWPYICWGHMCDSTQGSLCPSPMGIHQCMWIVINFAKYHILRTHYILHTTYILHVLRTEWVITQSLSELSSGKTKMSHVVLCNCPSLRHGKA